MIIILILFYYYYYNRYFDINIGPVCAAILVYTQLLYYAIEIHAGFKNIDSNGDMISLVIFMSSQILCLVLPCFVLYYEIRQIYYRVQLADATVAGRSRVASASMQILSTVPSSHNYHPQNNNQNRHYNNNYNSNLRSYSDNNNYLDSSNHDYGGYFIIDGN